MNHAHQILNLYYCKDCKTYNKGIDRQFSIGCENHKDFIKEYAGYRGYIRCIKCTEVFKCNVSSRCIQFANFEINGLLYCMRHKKKLLYKPSKGTPRI